MPVTGLDSHLGLDLRPPKQNQLRGLPASSLAAAPPSSHGRQAALGENANPAHALPKLSQAPQRKRQVPQG